MFRPDRLELRFSPVLAALVITAHLCAVLAVVLSAVIFPVQLLLIIAITVQAVYLCRRYVWLRHSRSVRSIRWSESQWFVVLLNGDEIEVLPTDSCRLFSGLTLLRFCSIQSEPGRARNSHFNLWLAHDKCSSQAIRRLRVQLTQTGSSQN